MTVPQIQDLVRALHKEGHADLAVSFEAMPQEMYLTDLANLLRACPIDQMHTDPYTRSLILNWQNEGRI